MGMWFKKKITNDCVPSFDELKKRTRILVIDDDPKSFPIQLLKDEGYDIEYWEKIERLQSLEEGRYDIIFLDIQGVGGQYSEQQGFGILELLKKKNPLQIIIAFSGSSYDLSYKKFWDMADDALYKPTDATKCKTVIDDLITNKITPVAYWEHLLNALKSHGFVEREIVKIEDEIARAIAKKNTTSLDVNCSDLLQKAKQVLEISLIIGKIGTLFI